MKRNPSLFFRRFLAVAVFFGAGSTAMAVNCNTNCISECGIGLGTPACLVSCEVQVAAACAAGPITAATMWKVQIKNNCRYNMEVAAHYLTTGHRWITDGWWQLSPGETAYILDTRNRFLYFSARTTPHGQFKWEGPHFWRVRGRNMGFLQKEILEGTFGTWTEHFRCDN